MARVLHLYDHQTPSAVLPTMRVLLSRQNSPVTARVGGASYGDLPAPDTVFRKLWGWTLTVAPEIRRFCNARDVDAIHCWSPALADASAATGRPTVVSVARPPTSRDAGTLRVAAEQGARIAATSATLSSRLARAGVPAEQLEVVAPAAEATTVTSAERSAIRKDWGISPDACVALAPPQHADDRGPWWALWATGILAHAGMDIVLVVPGCRERTARVRRFAADGRLHTRVRFPGPTDDALWRRLWAAADVALLYDDAGFSLPAAASAVAVNVPILAADTGELAAILRDGATAALATPRTPRLLARAIWQLHEQPDRAAALARAAAAELTDLTHVERMASRFDALYALQRV